MRWVAEWRTIPSISISTRSLSERARKCFDWVDGTTTRFCGRTGARCFRSIAFRAARSASSRGVCLYPLNGGCLVCFIELTKEAPYAKEFVYFHSHYSQKDIEEVKEQLKMLASQSSWWLLVCLLLWIDCLFVSTKERLVRVMIIPFSI